MKIIVISDKLRDRHVELIRKTARDAHAEVLFFKNEKEAMAEAFDADVVYGFGMTIAAKSRNLKWLCVPSAGVDYLLKPGSFANESCILTNSAGAYGVSIAEHMIAVLLIMLRQIAIFTEGARLKEWRSPVAQGSIKNSRITVLGAGDIGSSFAQRAKAFGPESLIAVNRSGISSEPAFDKVVKVSELNSILPDTDILAMSLPSTPETIGILNEERTRMLPQGAYIINVGRGSAIDERALAAALNDGHLAGAALDVFCKEPLAKDDPLWDVKNILITPHVAGNLTVEYTIDKNVEMFCEDLQNYAAGRELKYRVDKKAGY